MKLPDPRSLGRRAATWIGDCTGRSCSEQELTVALVGAFCASELCGEKGLVRQIAERLSTAVGHPMETTAVLARLGLAQPPTLPKVGPVPSGYDVLTAVSDDLPFLVGAVERASRFGGCPLSEDTGLADALSGAGLD